MEIRVFILQRAIVLQREKLSYCHYIINNTRIEEGTFGHNFITVHRAFESFFCLFHRPLYQRAMYSTVNIKNYSKPVAELNLGPQTHAVIFRGIFYTFSLFSFYFQGTKLDFYRINSF
jgi:hypothetical protein